MEVGLIVVEEGPVGRAAAGSRA